MYISSITGKIINDIDFGYMWLKPIWFLNLKKYLSRRIWFIDFQTYRETRVFLIDRNPFIVRRIYIKGIWTPFMISLKLLFLLNKLSNFFSLKVPDWCDIIYIIKKMKRRLEI